MLVLSEEIGTRKTSLTCSQKYCSKRVTWLRFQDSKNSKVVDVLGFSHPPATHSVANPSNKCKTAGNACSYAGVTATMEATRAHASEFGGARTALWEVICPGHERPGSRTATEEEQQAPQRASSPLGPLGP